MKKKILSQMVEQYQNRHKKPPEKIIVHPLALVSLGLRRSVAPVWNGIPVECREIVQEDGKKGGKCLGVSVEVKRKEATLVSFDC
jgi:hypothetical protein